MELTRDQFNTRAVAERYEHRLRLALGENYLEFEKDPRRLQETIQASISLDTGLEVHAETDLARQPDGSVSIAEIRFTYHALQTK